MWRLPGASEAARHGLGPLAARWEVAGGRGRLHAIEEANLKIVQEHKGVYRRLDAITVLSSAQ